ncbi:MAG: MFS transporter [Opitutaceae bacterium]|jgi:OPA family glycerol-3-phosphate transporter-like MFS transporter/OPA family sugar phosphate sensor protein UhpC-like MFS transporter|nr:MFS transporter [Opitutaceae bacterium]
MPLSSPNDPSRKTPFSLIAKAFAPAPAAPPLAPEKVPGALKFWQRRVLVSSIIGYAVYYFVRKNIGISIPAMEQDLGIGKAQLGLFLTLHGVLYGVSKFTNGFLGDRCNARVFMVVGLAASAGFNLLFGFSSAAVALGIFWLLNGWVQGMGFPPCARLMTHWYTPQKLITRMAVWNASHTIGGLCIVVLCGYLVVVDWRLCFIVPAVIALVCSVYLWKTLPDTPASVGLPEVSQAAVKKTEGSPGAPDFAEILKNNVFGNKYIWLLAVANFFVYTIRYAVLDWGPTLLKEVKHVEITHAGWMVAGFEFSGLVGTLVAGWLANRFFGGRCIRVCLLYMLLVVVAVLLFWRCAGDSRLLNTVLLGVIGFLIYGPQSLVGAAAANLATKHAAATAIGLTGFFGYASTVLSGWGLGALVTARGWDAVFVGLGVAGVAGAVLFAVAWPAKAHGYQELGSPGDNKGKA